MTDYLIVVNSKHPISPDFKPELVTVTNRRGREFTLEKATLENFLALRDCLEKEEGIIADLDSAYRGVEDQQRIWDEFTEKFGEEYARTYAAVPGASEHHTGLALDICIMEDGRVIDDNEEMNSRTDIFDRIYPLLPRFGFIRRYPHECWHYRYVGNPEIAADISRSGLSLEEYLQKRGE